MNETEFQKGFKKLKMLISIIEEDLSEQEYTQHEQGTIMLERDFAEARRQLGTLEFNSYLKMKNDSRSSIN